jgi:hypothetical protein
MSITVIFVRVRAFKLRKHPFGHLILIPIYYFIMIKFSKNWISYGSEYMIKFFYRATSIAPESTLILQTRLTRQKHVAITVTTILKGIHARARHVWKFNGYIIDKMHLWQWKKNLQMQLIITE